MRAFGFEFKSSTFSQLEVSLVNYPGRALQKAVNKQALLAVLQVVRAISITST